MHKSAKADTTREDYFRIIYSKTASLFEAAVLSGAVSAGAPEEWSAALVAYARNLGLAFQVKDDILDYAGDETVGKPLGIDLREGKVTLPLLCALESVSAEDAAEVRGWVAGIDSDSSLEIRVRAFVREHSGMEAAAREMDKLLDEAVSALDELPPSVEKTYLAKLARFVGERTF